MGGSEALGDVVVGQTDQGADLPALLEPRPECPPDLFPEHRDDLAMVGPGSDHQRVRPGVKPPEDDAGQEEALAYRSPCRHDGDRAAGYLTAREFLL